MLSDSRDGGVKVSFSNAQAPPPEQLHDPGHHERPDAGHPGAGRQRHHRQGEREGKQREQNVPLGLNTLVHLQLGFIYPYKCAKPKKLVMETATL